MPIPVAPTRTTCQSCGWSTITRHRSDVIFLPGQCERCGSEQLKHTETGGLASFNPATFILDYFKK